MSNIANIRAIQNQLKTTYGTREWLSRREPLDELIYTVLSQNTSDINSLRAFASLKHEFRTWDAAKQANPSLITAAIQIGGLAQIKAPRIHLILHRIHENRGDLDLTFLNEMPINEATDWLLRLPGVGRKTAACVLLFALGKPAFPVDTHVHRVSRRLEIIHHDMTAEKTHDFLQEQTPSEDVYQFHMDLIEHGRQVCKARKPRCQECTLQRLCPSKS